MSFHRQGLVGLGIGTVALVVLLTQTPTPTRANAPDAPNAKASPYDDTALGVVLRANANVIPKNGEDFMRVLQKVGDFGQLPVPFSAVAMTSGLTSPRVVIALRGREVGWGMQGQNAMKPTDPILEGRLFFAANFERSFTNSLLVTTLEFISWNTRKKQFEFGVIEFSPEGPQIARLDGVRCVACHKNKGPILGIGPWSNTTKNDVVSAAAATALESLHLRNHPPAQPGIKDPTALLRAQTTYDGMSVVVAEPEAVDFAVRLGSDLARERAIYRAMVKSADGRQAFHYLLITLVEPQPIEASYQMVKSQLDRVFDINYGNFGNDVATIHNTSFSTLHDYSPAGSMGKIKTTLGQEIGWGGGSFQPPQTTIVWSGTTAEVIAYDSRRSAGEPGIAPGKQPSNLKSYVRTIMEGVPPRPSAAVSGRSLALALGLTDADRAFLTKKLVEAVQAINQPKVTAAALAKEVFAGPSFADYLKAGDIPDREEFKDRFVEGLKTAAAEHQVKDLKIERSEYASAPRLLFTPGQPDPAAENLPSTACLRCHDVNGVGRHTFNPIPKLAFDPFDKPSRERWAADTSAAQKKATLERMLRRLVTEQDMPPEDSMEFALFRRKDPAAFEAIKEFLESELSKVKGK